MSDKPYRVKEECAGYKPFETEVNTKVDVYLRFKNSEGNGMGVPLPAGRVRVAKLDEADGSLEFIGEDRIDHTPRNEKILLILGSAFDVVGDRRQMEWRVTGNCESHSTWEIELRNRKDEPVEVDVLEPVGGD